MTDASFDLMVAGKMGRKAHNAQQRGIEFTLTFASMRNLMKAKKCYYTGLPLTEPVHGEALKATDRTIDRIDASKGYVKGNVVACCHAANQVKSQFEKAGVAGLKIGAQVFTKAIKRMEKTDD